VKTVNFESSLAESMTQLVALKRIQGYDYTARAVQLRYFDLFLCRQNWLQQCLTDDLLQRYMQQIEHLAPDTRHGRLSIVRVLSRFLHSHDPAIPVLYIAPVKRSSLPRFYLYSHEQIKALLSAALKIGPDKSARPLSFHMLIGLIYVTGLRIAEALGLQLRDLELEAGHLLVRHGKFNKERYVALHSSTVAQLRLYLEQRRPYARNDPDAALFVNATGKPLSYNSVDSIFRTLRQRTGIGSNAAQSPRLHDLRHTYACNCLAKWQSEGADVNAKLPLLATGMGHTKIEHTQIYLHVTSEQLREASECLRNYLNSNAKGN